MPSDPIPKPKRPEIDHKPRRRYTCLVIILVLITLPFILLLAGVGWLRHNMLKILTPADRAKLADSRTRILQLTAEWHEPGIAPSPENQRFQKDFNREVERLTKLHRPLIYGEGSKSGNAGIIGRMQEDHQILNDDNRSSFTQLKSDFEPLRERITSASLDEIVTQPGTIGFYYLNRREFTRTVEAMARAEAEAGHFREAIDLGVLPLKITYRPAISSISTHGISAALITEILDNLHYISHLCNDSSDLHAFLTTLNQQEYLLRPAELEHMGYADTFHDLKHLSALGIEVDMKPQPLAGYWKQANWIHMRDYKLWMINHLPAGDPRVTQAQTELAARSSGINWKRPTSVLEYVLETHLMRRPSPTAPSRFGYRVFTGLLGFEIESYARLGWDDMHSSQVQNYILENSVKYDLLRLQIAQKLAIAEGKMDEATSPTASTQAVTQYINPMPLDPFTSAPYPVSPDARFYSVGPDKVDNRASIPYNARSASASPTPSGLPVTGDIYLPNPTTPKP